jgi:hypothetical protein
VGFPGKIPASPLHLGDPIMGGEIGMFAAHTTRPDNDPAPFLHFPSSLFIVTSSPKSDLTPLQPSCLHHNFYILTARARKSNQTIHVIIYFLAVGSSNDGPQNLPTSLCRESGLFQELRRPPTSPFIPSVKLEPHRPPTNPPAWA